LSSTPPFATATVPLVRVIAPSCAVVIGPPKLSDPPLRLIAPTCVAAPPRFSVPPVIPIVPGFDQLVGLMFSVSPLETLITPWLVKLPAPWMMKLPPLRLALMVPAFTMPLPLRPLFEVLSAARTPTWLIFRFEPKVRTPGPEGS
jgi:hypothetical protein